MSALNAKRYNPDFVQFVQKMTYLGKAPKVIIVAIMRKFSIFFGMMKQMKNFDGKLAFFLEPKDGIYTIYKNIVETQQSTVYNRRYIE